MATALISTLPKVPVSKDINKTGGITLRGRGLPDGGVKEKALAALRAKIRTIILPEKNKKDIEEIPKDIQKKLNFVFVKHMDDVLRIALTKNGKGVRKPLQYQIAKPKPRYTAP